MPGKVPVKYIKTTYFNRIYKHVIAGSSAGSIAGSVSHRGAVYSGAMSTREVKGIEAQPVSAS